MLQIYGAAVEHFRKALAVVFKAFVKGNNTGRKRLYTFAFGIGMLCRYAHCNAQFDVLCAPDDGINALYAATLGLQAVNSLRETFREDQKIRVHGIITNGGGASNVIPDKVRIPSFVVVIASFVTMIDLLLKAFIPSLSASLGMYIPLIVVNCIIFARAESFAFKNGPIESVFDGLGMGLGFTMALTILSSIRECVGAGTIFGIQVMPAGYQPMSFAIMTSGGFIFLGLLLLVVNALVNYFEKRKKLKEEEEVML